MKMGAHYGSITLGALFATKSHLTTIYIYIYMYIISYVTNLLTLYLGLDHSFFSNFETLFAAMYCVRRRCVPLKWPHFKK